MVRNKQVLEAIAVFLLYVLLGLLCVGLDNLWLFWGAVVLIGYIQILEVWTEEAVDLRSCYGEETR